MKKYYLVLIVILLFGCELSDSSNCRNTLNLRIAVHSKNTLRTEVCVYIEGFDGNYLTGCTVIVLNSSGVASLLGFNLDKGCYYSEIPVSEDGVYEIRVNSSLLDDTIVKYFEHHVLKMKTELELFQNNSGASALSGETLSSEVPIQIGWSEVQEASIYQLEVYKAGNLVLVRSIPTTVTVIEPGALMPGTDYYCKIDAQYIKGDPLFESTFYYSFSEVSGSSFYFSVE